MDIKHKIFKNYTNFILNKKSKRMKEIIFNKFIGKVIEAFLITEEELFEKNKTRNIVNARQLLLLLCHDRNMTLVEISQYMKEKGFKIAHNNVSDGISQMKKKMSKDKDLKKAFKVIKNAF